MYLFPLYEVCSLRSAAQTPKLLSDGNACRIALLLLFTQKCSGLEQPTWCHVWCPDFFEEAKTLIYPVVFQTKQNCSEFCSFIYFVWWKGGLNPHKITFLQLHYCRIFSFDISLNTFFFNLKNMVPGNCHLHEPVYFESYHLGNARQNIYTTAILLDYPQRVLPKKKIIFSNSLNLIFFWSLILIQGIYFYLHLCKRVFIRFVHVSQITFYN